MSARLVFRVLSVDSGWKANSLGKRDDTILLIE